MPTLRINEFNNGSGHVDLTLISDSGETHTYGLNQNSAAPQGNSLTAVQAEDNLTAGSRPPHLVGTSDITISQAQYDAMNAKVQADLNTGVPYSLIGQNCVDWVQSVMRVGQVSGYVADYIHDISPPVAGYAFAEEFYGNTNPIALFAIQTGGHLAAEGLQESGNALELAMILVQSLTRQALGVSQPNILADQVVVTSLPNGTLSLASLVQSDTHGFNLVIPSDVTDAADVNAVQTSLAHFDGPNVVLDSTTQVASVTEQQAQDAFDGYANAVETGQSFTPSGSYTEPEVVVRPVGAASSAHDGHPTA